MNGKYYGKREIRWHSREKDRLEHIHKRKEGKDESNRGNRGRHWVGNGNYHGNVSFEFLDRPQYPSSRRCETNMVHHCNFCADVRDLDF